MNSESLKRLRSKRHRSSSLSSPPTISFRPDASDPKSPSEVLDFEGPVPLVRKGLALPTGPGIYLVACGDCLAHVGTSGNLRGRVRTLAALGTHRGSNEVLCAAYCTAQPPQVWWRATDLATARRMEPALKGHYGEPPVPREKYASCVNGLRLMDDLVAAAGNDSWEAGYVEAVFTIGENLTLLFKPRFGPIWANIGVPPGPWS